MKTQQVLQQLAMILILLGLVACQTAVSTLSEGEQTAVYTAAIRQVVTVDDTFGGMLNPPIIYILIQTDDSIGDPEIKQLPSMKLSTQQQNDISTALGDLDAQVTWINSFDDVNIDETSGALVDEGVVVTIGNIQLHNNGSAQISASIYIAGLAAGGQTYILEQVDGQWTVTGNTGVQWIS
ncbi:MAG: hypothetical protein DWQ04_34535 [Chloroflexi bacterium]|nr:MAG: hypothetical protein DWQ04_34535 [Chloroflexota bacterium]